MAGGRRPPPAAPGAPLLPAPFQLRARRRPPRPAPSAPAPPPTRAAQSSCDSFTYGGSPALRLAEEGGRPRRSALAPPRPAHRAGCGGTSRVRGSAPRQTRCVGTVLLCVRPDTLLLSPRKLSALFGAWPSRTLEPVPNIRSFQDWRGEPVRVLQFELSAKQRFFWGTKSVVSWKQLEAFHCTMEQQLQGMLNPRLVTARTVAALGGTGKRFSINTVPLLPGHGGYRLCEKHRTPAH